MDKDGALSTGTMEAESERNVIESFDKLGYSVISVDSGEKNIFSVSSFMRDIKPISKKDIILFTRQLAILLRSGTPLSPSLIAVHEQTENKKLKNIIESICKSLEKGETFSGAFAKHKDVFPELFVSMAAVGEAGGILDKVLDRLASLGTQEMETQSRITSALIYPLVLVAVAFAVISFLIMVVLPKFVVVFSASGAKLPIPTRIILNISWILRTLWLPIVVVGGFIFLWFKNSLKNEEAKARFHSYLLKLPIFGPLYAKIQISRFARITSALISSGIPILDALDVVEKTITNLAIRRALKDIRRAISEGHSLVEPFKASGLFNPMVIQMISTGEKSGNLGHMLDEVASFYDPEIEYTIKNLTSLLEPIMLLVMGAMVAFIALSVLLPIFNLIKVFRK